MLLMKPFIGDICRSMEFAKKKGNPGLSVAGGVKKDTSERKKGKMKQIDDSNLPPEERERRRIQRELRVRMAPAAMPYGMPCSHAGETMSGCRLAHMKERT